MLNLDFCEYRAQCLKTRRRRLIELAATDSSWFDVDTLTVLTRCYKTLLPREDYVNEVLSGVPDLYGESPPSFTSFSALDDLTRFVSLPPRQVPSGSRRLSSSPSS